MRDEETHELIDDVDAVDAVDDENGANVPEKIPGIRASGPVTIMSMQEKRQRRQSMSNLLAAGRSDDEIAIIMEKGYNMSQEATERLRDAVLDRWAVEDASRHKHLKAAARRRLYDHIKKASDANQFTAVAGLERTLASIEGTEEVRGGNATESPHINNTIIAVLGDMNPEQIQEYVNAGTRLFQEQQKVELPSGDRIVVTPSE